MAGNGHSDRSRWQARPALARALSAVVFVAPLAGSYAATRALAPFLDGLGTVQRILVLGVFAVVVGLAAERALRRVLPLAALLRMTMLFPDRAPSRFKLARAAGNTRILEERARSKPGETAGEAATRILGLLSALGAHDRRTRGHSERVRVFTDVLAAELHLNQAARDRLRWAALLHDLGKVAVPAAVLNKPGALDADEWDLIRQHPARGAVLAGPLLEWLGEWGAAIEQHHERFDGRGYPYGRAGHDIALSGRIVAVADSFEVMTAARSYKRPMSVRTARRELAAVAGTQLDPACVRAFLGAGLPRVLWAVGPLALLLNLPFLRGLAEVGKVVEQAGVTAAGQATTAAVAATTAVVVVASSGAGPAQAAAPLPTSRTAASQSSHQANPTAHPSPIAVSEVDALAVQQCAWREVLLRSDIAPADLAARYLPSTLVDACADEPRQGVPFADGWLEPERNCVGYGVHLAVRVPVLVEHEYLVEQLEQWVEARDPGHRQRLGTAPRAAPSCRRDLHRRRPRGDLPVPDRRGPLVDVLEPGVLLRAVLGQAPRRGPGRGRRRPQVRSGATGLHGLTGVRRVSDSNRSSRAWDGPPWSLWFCRRGGTGVPCSAPCRGGWAAPSSSS